MVVLGTALCWMLICVKSICSGTFKKKGEFGVCARERTWGDEGLYFRIVFLYVMVVVQVMIGFGLDNRNKKKKGESNNGSEQTESGSGRPRISWNQVTAQQWLLHQPPTATAEDGTLVWVEQEKRSDPEREDGPFCKMRQMSWSYLQIIFLLQPFMSFFLLISIPLKTGVTFIHA